MAHRIRIVSNHYPPPRGGATLIITGIYMKVKFNVRKTTAKEKLEFILGTVLIILIIWFFVR